MTRGAAWGESPAGGTPPASCHGTGLSTQTVHRAAPAAGQPPRTSARLERRGGGSRHLPRERPGLRVQSGWLRAKPVTGQEGSALLTALWEAVSHPRVVSPDGLPGGGDGEQRAPCVHVHVAQAGAVGRGPRAVECACPRRDGALGKASSGDGPIAQCRARRGDGPVLGEGSTLVGAGQVSGSRAFGPRLGRGGAVLLSEGTARAEALWRSGSSKVIGAPGDCSKPGRGRGEV